MEALAKMDPITLVIGGAVLLGIAYILVYLPIPKRAMLNWPDRIAETAQAITYPKYNIPKKVVVTGGSGFVGRHLVSALVQSGCDVTVFDIRPATFDEPEVKMVTGDLTKLEEVKAAFRGAQVVFHVASPNPLSRNVKVFEAVNVGGAKNVVDACVAEGVPRLVFTSSASVIYAGTDQAGTDESVPYPKVFRDDYCRTKALAEQIIMDAGAKSGGKLVTVSIRPHGIFGPGDPLLLPSVANVGKTGKNKVAIGSTTNLVDYTYVGNVVHGHMLAAQAATPGSAVSGKTYFITNDDPLPFWAMLGKLLIGLGYAPQSLRLPFTFMLVVAHAIDAVLGAVRAAGVDVNITLTPSVVQLAGTHHWYSCEAAKKDLGYRPVWDMDAALWKTLVAFPEHRAPGAAPLPGTTKTISAAEVAKHNSLEDLWVIINGGVYDLTEYVDAHPGGDKIAQHAGGDATEGFHGPQHPDHVHDTVEQFRVGDLE